MLRGAVAKCHKLVVNGLLDMDWNTDSGSYSFNLLVILHVEEQFCLPDMLRFRR